ncbi:MAG: galactose mutarotase [Sedimentisphaerales bacterium]|nr:galactose mutarotase [Sedimentisphaerales bacterium]MBN2844173.1 galactose mutarotase [Sedimentisphaerales bacterium]
MEIRSESFGVMADGKPVELFTLSNDNGLSAKITNFGGILVEMNTPDKHGKLDNIQLGLADYQAYTSEPYLSAGYYLGAIIGRYGNRIKNGKFSIDGIDYSLFINNGPNSLHGGKVGYDKRLWDAQMLTRSDAVALQLTLTDEDMNEGYPGNLDISVTYTLNNDNELRMEYFAITDKPTVVNMTQHSYWNLAGAGNGNICGHELKLYCDKYTQPDDNLIPTGKLIPVAGTEYDFTSPKLIGKDIDKLPFGYDHNFVIRSKGCDSDLPNCELAPAAELFEPDTGRFMNVSTNQPGVQCYTAFWMNGSVKDRNGKPLNKFGGVCLETQHYPDSPNRPEFPTTLLLPSQTYHHLTVHKFGVR